MDRPRWMWWLAGMAATAVALGAGELTAGLLGGGSIIAAIGALVIALQPPGAKDLMVSLFGTYDKLALEVMTASGGLLVGGLLGLIARRDMRGAVSGLLAIAVVGFLLLVQDPLSGPISSAATVVAAAVAGSVSLTWLARMIGRPQADDPASGDAALQTPSALARRSFLAAGATVVAVGGVVTLVGRYLGTQLTSVGPPVAIPAPSATLPPVPSGADFGIAGLSPIVVPNDSFYRIDTRLSTPHLDASTWKLRIHGVVEREVTLSYADLLRMPLVERYVTISCVSNEVGGYLVGNAKWTGVSLVSVLDSAGVQAAATQIVPRSFDGWTAGFPTAHLSGAGSEAMIALQMNGVPLPAEHGFPARLIVPGLYGYVSATKWLTELELTTLEAFDAYWVPLGWAKQAPILTQSRIDVPRPGSVGAGPLQIAGVAWAPTRGISRVEVKLDTEPWREAELSLPLSTAAWVQWRTTVDVAAGPHSVQVRATDGTGETQTETRTPPAPDGARGHHSIRFNAA